MIDSRSLAEYTSQILSTTSTPELDQRLGLYRVFLKLYEHHRALLDEILDLENTSSTSHLRVAQQYIQGVIQGQQAYLITNLLPEGTRSLCQSQQVWLIGRDRVAAVQLPDGCLSRRHAAIQYIEGQGFYLIDLNSTNGSFVNGEPVRHCTPLKDGDQVRLGSLTFTFFICHTPKSLDTLPPEVLAQVNTARQAIPPTQVPSLGELDSKSRLPVESGSSAEDSKAATVNSAKDTSMFLRRPYQSVN